MCKKKLIGSFYGYNVFYKEHQVLPIGSAVMVERCLRNTPLCQSLRKLKDASYKND